MVRGDVTLELTLPSGAKHAGPIASVMDALKRAMRARADEPAFRDDIAMRMGQIYVRSVRQTLEGGAAGAKPNSRLTLSTKASGTPLVHTGRLAGAAMVRQGMTGEVILSFRGAAQAGVPLEMIAAQQQRAGRQVVTAQMVRFFRAAVLRDGWDKGFLKFREGDVIRRPARKFMQPAFKTVRAEMASMIGRRLIEEWNKLAL